jgi:hypothetical protein
MVASDLFGTSFTQHFGPGQRPQDRLLANLKAAGVDGRATIETADMLKLPFEDHAFDAPRERVTRWTISAETGSRTALSEAHRVLEAGRRFSAHPRRERRLGKARIRTAALRTAAPTVRPGGAMPRPHGGLPTCGRQARLP